ncbi:hypothetical protein RCO48_12990 [Peribacillus frigoritolerans]|nr:hypothetical protein [Peribacillus frigoritolerans]
MKIGKGKLPWKAYMDYSLYEWVAVIVTTSGLIISCILGFIFLKKMAAREKKAEKKECFKVLYTMYRTFVLEKTWLN